MRKLSIVILLLCLNPLQAQPPPQPVMAEIEGNTYEFLVVESGLPAIDNEYFQVTPSLSVPEGSVFSLTFLNMTPSLNPFNPDDEMYYVQGNFSSGDESDERMIDIHFQSYILGIDWSKEIGRFNELLQLIADSLAPNEILQFNVTEHDTGVRFAFYLDIPDPYTQNYYDFYFEKSTGVILQKYHNFTYHDGIGIKRTILDMARNEVFDPAPDIQLPIFQTETSLEPSSSGQSSSSGDTTPQMADDEALEPGLPVDLPVSPFWMLSFVILVVIRRRR